MFSYDAPSSSNDSSALRYLENTIRTAPPAKLRLMLIERAVGLCESISARWRLLTPEMGCDEQTLHLRDILTELLAGVGRSDLPVALAVSDLYVFLSKHLTDAEMMRDVTMIDEIGLVLQTEAETWRIVFETTNAALAASQNAPFARQSPVAEVSTPLPTPHMSSAPIARTASLNLQG
jgi:flagellar secretion chaperone FliS